MSIEKQLDDDLKAAMRAKEPGRVACVRQVRAKTQEAMNAPGFKGPTDDAFYAQVIGTYVRWLQKAMGELEAAGEKGKALRDSYQAEVTYLAQYLPKLLDEAQTRALVTEAIAATGAKAPSDAGKVMGAVMKAHKAEVDASLVKRLADEALKG
jgi:uncharacterized protein YqeY